MIEENEHFHHDSHLVLLCCTYQLFRSTEECNFDCITTLIDISNLVYQENKYEENKQSEKKNERIDAQTFVRRVRMNTMERAVSVEETCNNNARNDKKKKKRTNVR